MRTSNATEQRACVHPQFADNEPGRHDKDDDAIHRLELAIEQAAHVLPAQGPITTFVHHNTLHAFEELPFVEAVEKAGQLFGCEPYWSEDRYRDALRTGRIRSADLEVMLQMELGEQANEAVVPGCTRCQLRLTILEHPLRTGPAAELLWYVAETDALRRMSKNVSAAARVQLIAETRRWAMRDLRNGNGRRSAPNDTTWADGLFDKCGRASFESWTEDEWEAFTLRTLWRVCCNGVAGVPRMDAPVPAPRRHRDLLLAACGIDADRFANDVLIRFTAAFLDQGLSHWSLPRREEGFFRAFVELYRTQAGAPASWQRELARELAALNDLRLSPLQSIRESLDQLGVPKSEWEGFLTSTFLVLRGWAGMTKQVEERRDRVVRPIPQGSITDFLAIRLVLDRVVLAHIAREAFGFAGPLRGLRNQLSARRAPEPATTTEQRAFSVFQLAQVLGWTPERLSQLDDTHWRNLVNEIEAFSPLQRRRVFHLAYEHRFYTRTLDAIAIHNREPREEPKSPSFQAMFCIDEREESLRRHVEEVASSAVTFSIAGFYFVDMYYKGLEDAHFVPLCPPVVRPKHWVVETVADDLAATHRLRAQTRQALGKASHQFHIGTRSFLLGALFSGALGVLASIPLIAGTLFPRIAARLRRVFGGMIRPPHRTRLDLEHSASTTTSDAQPGYTVESLTDIAERILRDTGLTSGFSRFVFTFGHGSTSVNNPHESAYNCGACGGGRGGASGRAAAQILNDPRVRQRLQSRGIVIPDDTVFIGGMHNTGNDQITFHDLDRLPDSHHVDFEMIWQLLETACERNAHERCRRFESASLGLSQSGARGHVEGRAEDLAQVRPELGHATNAICIVGRRTRTRGLFLDRRAFLNSYDPTQDDADATILLRILQAAIPVCAGISLEYYFSCVDCRGYGCGSKLPHNVASLLGVMEGAASDLRTGLPWQMVEIHEPVRILFVIETTPDKMLRIMERNEMIGRLVRNGWVQLALLDPDSSEIQSYKDGAFHAYVAEAEQLPCAATSVDWYRGWRDHLEFAQIGV